VPGGPGGGDDDSELVFVTHMPGVSVPPRPKEFEHDEDLARLAAKLRGEDAEKDEANSTLTMRLVQGAGKLGRAAGKGAWERTLEASRKSSGGMSQMFHRVETRNVAGVVNVVKPKTPSFGSLFAGALVAPLRKGSLPAILGGTAMLALAVLLLELSLVLGLICLLVAGVELMALRVKFVREVAHGRDELVWPEWSEVLAALPAYPAALVVLAPPLIVGLLALGDSAWDKSQPGSVPRRAALLLSPGDDRAPPSEEDLAPLSEEERILFGRTGLIMLEAAIGSPRDGYDPRTPEQIAVDVRERGLDRVQRWLIPSGGLSTLGMVAWALGLMGLIAFPMGLLAVAKLESGYAAFHVPLMIRSMLRTALHYPVVVIFFLVQDMVLLMALLGAQPFFQAKLGSLLGHLAAVGFVSALVVILPVVSGSLLGRFYRSHANELGWEG
jgi:hypothetical protein